MAITEQEWKEIFAHTRTRAREVGLEEIDNQISMDFRSSASASLDFLRYLENLISAVVERSESGYEKTLDAIRESVATESGEIVQGIEIQIQDGDEGLFGIDSIDLAGLTDQSLLIQELMRLKDDLVQADLFDEQISD